MSRTDNPTESSIEHPNDMDTEEWPDHFRRVMEYFYSVEDVDEWESGGRYPIESDPYVLHTSVRAPLRPGGEAEYSWHILHNPWTGPERTAWKMDGRPLLPSETAHGAPEDEKDPLIANDRDLVDIPPGQVYVCVALTEVAQIHSRGETWIHCDDEITEQFGNVLDELEAELGEEDDADGDPRPDGGRKAPSVREALRALETVRAHADANGYDAIGNGVDRLSEQLAATMENGSWRADDAE